MIVTIKNGDRYVDIKADEKMKITDMLSVVAESGLINICGNIKVRAMRENKEIATDHNFNENEIYNGDILEIL